MKKIISVVIATIMAVSVFAMTAVSAFAAPVNSPTASTATDRKPTLQVNGTPTTTDITYTPDKENSTTIHFVYTGDGKLVGWEDNLKDLGLVEGVDFTATTNSDGSLTIKFITNDAVSHWKNGDVLVNAVVDFGNGQTGTTAVKPNTSNKSPSTGVSTSVIAGSVALAGAGIAVLSAAKKKDAE